MRLLLVEDDRLLGDGIAAGLRQDGYVVDWVQSGEQGLLAVSSETFDLVILDLGLPGIDGIDVVKKLRKQGNVTPVLVLTARDTVDDRVQGLDVGADDYMVKPFDLNELGARVRALLRHSKGRGSPELIEGDLVLNPKAHTVQYKGQPVDLSPREFSVLQELLENAGHVVSKARLQETVYGWQHEVDSNAMEVHVHNLRKKLDNDLIRTMRGVGYVLKNHPDI